MAFSYSGDPTESTVDLLRFTLGDTDESSPLMQDAEYEYLISQYPNASDQNKLIAAAFRAGATHLAMKNVKRSLGPQSEDPRERAAYFADMADKYENQSAFTSTPPVPDYDADKIFYKGMMANET